MQSVANTTKLKTILVGVGKKIEAGPNWYRQTCKYMSSTYKLMGLIGMAPFSFSDGEGPAVMRAGVPAEVCAVPWSLGVDGFRAAPRSLGVPNLRGRKNSTVYRKYTKAQLSKGDTHASTSRTRNPFFYVSPSKRGVSSPSSTYEAHGPLITRKNSRRWLHKAQHNFNRKR